MLSKSRRDLKRDFGLKYVAGMKGNKLNKPHESLPNKCNHIVMEDYVQNSADMSNKESVPSVPLTGP
jgi:hypothetical protein